MALTLSKTNIITGNIILKNYVDNTVEALTGEDAYNISQSGSLTISGSLNSLNISGSITNTGNLTTSAIISGSGIAATSALASVGDFTIRGNTSLGNSITDTTTINGNITGSGDIKVAGLVSASSLNITGNSTLGNSISGVINPDTITIKGNITGSGTLLVHHPNESDGISVFVSGSLIIGKKNGLTFTNAEPIDTLMNKSTFPPDSVIGINSRTANEPVEFTLPDKEAGLEYTFISFGNPSGGSTTVKIVADDTNIMNGMAICDDGIKDIPAQNFILFAATKFLTGTRVHCISDGTIWQVTAFCLCEKGDISTS